MERIRPSEPAVTASDPTPHLLAAPAREPGRDDRAAVPPQVALAPAQVAVVAAPGLGRRADHDQVLQGHARPARGGDRRDDQADRAVDEAEAGQPHPRRGLVEDHPRVEALDHGEVAGLDAPRRALVEEHAHPGAVRQVAAHGPVPDRAQRRVPRLAQSARVRRDEEAVVERPRRHVAAKVHVAGHLEVREVGAHAHLPAAVVIAGHFQAERDVPGQPARFVDRGRVDLPAAVDPPPPRPSRR